MSETGITQAWHDFQVGEKIPTGCNVNLKTNVQIAPEGDGFAITFPEGLPDGRLVKSLVAVDENVVVWTHDLSHETVLAEGGVRVPITWFTNSDLDICRSLKLFFRILLWNEDEDALEVALLKGENAPIVDGDRAARMVGIIPIPDELIDPAEYNSKNNREALDHGAVAVPYYNVYDNLALLFSHEGSTDRYFVRVELRSIKAQRDGTMKMVVRMPKGNRKPLGTFVVCTQRPEVLRVPLRSKITEDDQAFIIETYIGLSDIDGIDGTWNLRVHAVSAFGTEEEYGVRVMEEVGRPLRRRRVYFEDRKANRLFFPTWGAGGTLYFILREKAAHEERADFMRERAACIFYRLTHRYWDRKGIVLIHEKKSFRAQDNGFFFFKYCMENAPADIRKRIFFVIDKDSPDYPRVLPYKKNVLQFMSFKELLYCLAAKSIVSSEAPTHLYLYRPMPNNISRSLRNHRYLCLQHGVTAMKRLDSIFSPLRYAEGSCFLVCSKNEQDIVVDALGYERENVPILGFSRWDLLEDKSDAAHPVIHMMLTWRDWLERLSLEEFEESQYYLSCKHFLENERLHQLLAKHNATLRFYLHPYMQQYRDMFASTGPNVEIMTEGKRPLNELIMESSMFVTDYSSVCWDALYLDKPVVFFQFDQQDYLEHRGSHIDLDTELPGPVCKDEDACIAAIERYLENGFSLSAQEREKADPWFAHRDKNNRKRTLDFLIEGGWL